MLDEMLKRIVVEKVMEEKNEGMAKYAEEALVNLPALCRKFHERHEFKVGDLVTWKPNMKNRRFPAYGSPMVVMELISPPATSSTDESGSPNYRERLDIQLGVQDEDGDLLLYHYDSRRFMPYVETGKNHTLN